MEKTIRAKVNDHNEQMKTNIQKWFQEKGANVHFADQNLTSEFIQYIMDFPNVELNKEDFQKRKRLKNNVPDYNRCIALKCNGERCSRKQKNEHVSFCGTHLKGSNYGTTQQHQPNVKKETIQ